jgi:multiple sugar transport system permease protein
MTPRPRWLSAVRLVLLLLVLAWSAFPILLVILASFKPARIIFDIPPRFLFAPTLENYRLLLRAWPEFFPRLGNSLIVTVGTTVLTVVASALAGYVYARYRGGLLAASAFFMVVIRMLPPIVITLPLFPVVNWLGIMDTYSVLIVLYATFFVSLGTWIMKTFVDQIPQELEEAAFVDGASLWQTLRQVILPLTVPGMIASSVFVLVYAWNEFLFAFIFTTTRAKTAPLLLSEMLGSVTGVDWGAVFAAATIQLVPVLAFVILVQKYLIAGLTAGSVKG